jgi:hypothetical protein
MDRALTENEMRRVERLARRCELAKLLSFFEALPKHIYVPRPLVLGSNNEYEILVKGFCTRHAIIKQIANLDEPYNPGLRLQKTIVTEKRAKPVNAFATVLEELRKGFAKVCLAEELGECGGKIVQAHSLQKATFKSRAKKGHVYEFDAFSNQGSRIWPRLIGINDASTFAGFCEKHDSQLFSPIENEPFDGRAEQIFLYHYRAVAHAFYNRAYKATIFERAYPKLEKLVPAVEIKNIKERIWLNQLEIQDLRCRKAQCEDQIRKKDWSNIEAYVWIGDRAPDIFATDYFALGKDFLGKPLQDRKSLNPLKLISLTVSASDDKAIIVLCGNKECELLRALVTSLRKLPSNLLTMAFVNCVFCQLENFILVPDWWESRSKVEQESLMNAFNSRYFPRELPIVSDWNLKELNPSKRFSSF